jgi:hypothetical protein
MFKWYGSGEVGFSEMMRTQPFKLQDQGEIEAHFLKYDFKKRLHFTISCSTNLRWYGLLRPCISRKVTYFPGYSKKVE